MAIRKTAAKKTPASKTMKTAPKKSTGAKSVKTASRKPAAPKAAKPSSKPARKPARKKAEEMELGSGYECSVCGLAVSVDKVCGCVDTCDIVCCGEPMQKVWFIFECLFQLKK
jgi:hypothetical protein